MRLLQSLPLLAGVVSALSSAEWRSQSIYQVLTDRFALANGSTSQSCDWGNYCGGSWQGILNKLDYIKGMGFTAVWISPVVKNIADSQYGRPYHGYWAQDIYSLNSNFGTADDLKALSAGLHARGMYLMVDVVANHMASSSAPSAVKYNQLLPFNDAKYYHPYCPLDYSNATSVQICWMGDTKVPLPDLRTEDAIVQQTFQRWIAQLVQDYSIDGLRLDSAMQTNQEFWPGFVSASGIYSVGEVLDGNPNTLCKWQNYMPGMLNYAAYYWLIRAFSTNTATMNELANNIQWLAGTCQDITLLGNFIENHDQARFPSITTDAGLIKNAIAFIVLNDGIPIVYQGQEQGFSGAVDPYNREPLWTSGYSTKASLYTFIASLNGARRLAITKDTTYAAVKQSVIYSDSQTLVTRKGASASSLISIFTNRGVGNSGKITIPVAKTSFKANTRFTDLLSCDVFTTDTSGNLPVVIKDGLPRALYLSASLSGSDICAYTNTGGVELTTTARVVSSTSNVQKTSTSTATKVTSTSSTRSVTSAPSSTTKAASTSAASPTTIKTSVSSTSSTDGTAPTMTSVATCGGLTNGTTYTTSTNGKSFLIECGVDHFGGDLASVQVSSTNGFKQCIDACASNSACVDVSLSGVACYLKHSVGTNVYNDVYGAKLITSASSSTQPSSTSSSATSTSSSCPVASTVAVTFNQVITTQWLESVSLVGSISELGSWKTSDAFNLSAASYTSTTPLWSGTVNLTAGATFEYKFIKYNTTTKALLAWEADPNRVYTVPRSCSTSAVVGGKWQE
ncbi:Putative carbohydrate binding module family 20, glycosyl hydrolase, family 13, catalytic [Septoria linicola]|uniref:alpha-amylase n=1 Tax=Septoria linicola TaxID=215465 RepID=A0A9Q9EKT3_9PEZI|nr:Putative carbohydrate binding module family 20, glycosyl hydrolase, family 13, catalytic [Septoria linicola]